jgi:small-conductance mechanosensitive channel
MRHEIRRWVLLLVVCLVLAGILPVGLLPVASAQDQTPQSTTPASGREVVATAVAEGTPVVAEVASGAVAGLSDLTMQNVLFLLAYFGIIILAVVYGSQLISHLLSRLARRTSTTLDDALVEAIRPQIRWLIAAIGFQIVTFQLEFITGFWESVLRTSYFLLYWFVGMSTCWRAIDISLQWYVERQGQDMDARVRDKLLPLGRRLALLLLAVFGIGILLAHFGVNLIAAAGVLGLTGFAISLAAKDTITNIISGIVIMFDAPFTVGDRIDLKDLDVWGDVVEIGLRSTKVVTRDNRLVIIPNSAVVDNQVVNYSLPDPTYRLQVDLGIGSSVDIPWVKETLENAVRGVEGVLADKPVDILFTGFGDSSNAFRVRWWVASPGEKRRVTDGVCAAIQKTANEKGIDMPQPAFTLDNRVKISPEEAGALLSAPSASES